MTRRSPGANTFSIASASLSTLAGRHKGEKVTCPRVARR